MPPMRAAVPYSEAVLPWIDTRWPDLVNDRLVTARRHLQRRGTQGGSASWVMQVAFGPQANSSAPGPHTWRPGYGALVEQLGIHGGRRLVHVLVAVEHRAGRL
jgi:hypothetical protein